MSRFSKPTLSVIILFYGLQLLYCSTGEESTGSPSNCSHAVLYRGETVSSCCVFPFIYLGEQHNSCIKIADGTAWCSTTSNYDIDGKKTDCPTTKPDDGGGGDGEGHCHSFLSSLSSLIGGTVAPDRRWNLQCQPSRAVTSLWDDVHGFTLLGDVKCCDAPVDQNISYVFNLSMRIGGRFDPVSKWKAQCPDNYVITGLHAQKAGLKQRKAFGNLDAVKCSLLLEHRLDYSSCTTVDLPDKTGGTRDPAALWRTECPSEHFMSALYNDHKFGGVKKIKCCPSRAVAISQKVCTFENEFCSLWESIIHQDGSWTLRNGTGLGTVDHTTGKTTGHVIQVTSNTSQLSSVGVKSSKQGRCLSLWYTMKGDSKIYVLALQYDENVDGLVEQNLDNVETGEDTKWTEKQVVLPRNANYQLIIRGIVSSGSPSEIALDDIQIKPERFCTGLCSSLGPLQGSTSIHDGPITLWQASCRAASSSSPSSTPSSTSVTSVVTGLWDKQKSHFHILEYIKCCNMPVDKYYKVLLTGKEGGDVSEHKPWNAQCKENHVLTGIYSLNKFNGFYQLQCSSLVESRVDYSNCVVIWTEERNHVGDSIRRHVECPTGMAVIGLFDHQGDNNMTSFADIDAVKCCMVDTPDCVTQADCNFNAECISINTVKKCICRAGFYGNGKLCKVVVPPTWTTKFPSPKKQNTATNVPANPSTLSTTSRNTWIGSTRHGLGFSTSRSLSNQRRQNDQSLTLVICVAIGGILVAVVLAALVWRVRRVKKARLQVEGSNTPKDQAEMTPFNDMKIINNDNPVQDQQGGEEDDFSRATNNCPQNGISKARGPCKPRSATILSAEHAYMSEEDLDPKCIVREPFYFELDKTACQKTYSIHRSLALPEPMYGILEPENLSSPEEQGAHFWIPADTEEELYLQLSREIKREQIELGTERLGSGAFGHVLLGVWLKSPGIPVQVAVKMLRDSSHRENKIKFLQEAAIMRQFTHKNVVYMYGIVANSEPAMIVLEYMSRGNLKNYLRRLDNKYGEKILLQEDTKSQFLRMARDIAAGMQYLHSLAFVHRDLAARNILLDSDMTCKIGDFGMSRDLVESDYYTSRGGRIPVKWTAPEAINYGKYSSSSDVWSYGIVLYEIWSLGHKPYETLDNNEVIEAVSRGYRLPPPLHCPTMLYRLMVDCWHPESQNRPRSYQIHHCLCFSHQSVFLDDSLCIKQRSKSELPSVDTSTYMDLKYVYAVTE